MELKLSIVTICFNNLDELIVTLQSVDRQVLKPNEHIIINGSTTPDIAQYFTQNAQPIYRKVISERDKGISDAFNKGINLAQGNIIHILNSGDEYYTELSISKITEAFINNPKISWLHGKYIQTKGGKEIISGIPFDKALVYRGMRQTAHPSMVVKKELYAKHGLYSLDKKIAMDYDFLIRIKDEPFIFLDSVLVKFDGGGVSEQQISVGLKEVKESYEKAFGYTLKLKLWQIRILLLNTLINNKIGRIIYSLLKG